MSYIYEITKNTSLRFFENKYLYPILILFIREIM